ncbi:MAG TPA: delta-60 repeat domain-containing protein [Solirubrobacterales bacterium]|nr:delta-60 repeat domain-containing protein [Solirubrobacterales bacterium]
MGIVVGGLALLVLVACAAALAAGPRVVKTELAGGPGQAEAVLTYDGKRLLLLSSDESEAITRVFADGSPDRSFGDGGRVEMPFADVAVAPDGKLLIAGWGSAANSSNSDAQVTRLLPNGAPDPSFGQGGVARIDLGGRYDGAQAVAIGARGRILVGGTKQTIVAERGGSDAVPALARLLPDGGVDRGFGKGGVRLLGGGWEGGIYDLAPTRDGGIVAQGEGYIGTAVWKLHETGSLDRGFGKGGEVIVEGRGKKEKYGWEEELEAIEKMVVLPSGKIMLAGTGSRYGERKRRYRFLALRLRADGSLDRSFGRDGYAAAVVGGWTFASALAPLPGGGLLVTGSAQTPDGKRSDVGAVAFTASGKLDRRFGNRGKMRVDLEGWDGVDDVTVQGRRAVILGAPKDPRRRWLVSVPLRQRR